jgi:hypothetical protein
MQLLRLSRSACPKRQALVAAAGRRSAAFLGPIELHQASLRRATKSLPEAGKYIEQH